jgi:hypothetical protein
VISSKAEWLSLEMRAKVNGSINRSVEEVILHPFACLVIIRYHYSTPSGTVVAVSRSSFVSTARRRKLSGGRMSVSLSYDSTYQSILHSGWVVQKKLMKAKDARVELNSEVLSGMKVIKFQA